MAGGDELDALGHELRRSPGTSNGGSADQAAKESEQPKDTV
jgi:hypothetical protein